MRRGLLFLLVGVFLCGKVFAASLHEIPHLTILPYTNKAAISEGLSLADATIVSEFVMEQLLDTHRFKVAEREFLDDVLMEMAFTRGGMVDSSMARNAGKQIGADYIIAGSITGLSTKSSGVDVSDTDKGDAGFNKNTVVANVNIRFIDVETGEVVLMASGTGESARTNSEFSLKRRRVTDYETDSLDENGYETIYDETETQTSERKITIGSHEFSYVQVRNALYKAVGDMIYNKNYGVLAKMDGKSKRRKV